MEQTNNNDNSIEETANNDNAVTDKKNDDRHVILEPYTKKKNFEELTQKEKESLYICFPADSEETIQAFLRRVNRIPDKFVKEKYTDSEKSVTVTNVNSLAHTLLENDFVERINKEKDQFVNDINYGDKKLNTKILKITDKENMSQSAMVAKLSSYLSVGELIHVPLWHSGFWVTLRPPTLKELTNLDIAIASSETTLGRETSTLIYSNYSVVINRIISEFIVNHIHETTLNIPEDEDIRKYILLPDFYLLVNGICASMHPDGYSIKKACRNTLVINEDNKPKCNFELNAVVDPKKLLFVDRKSLTKNMLEQMSNRTVGSVSINAIKDYQLSIDRLLDKTVDIHTNNKDVNLKMTLSLPTLLDHVNMGDRWINDIIKSAEATYTDADTNETKQDKLQKIIYTCGIASNNTFIKSISIPNEKSITEEQYILEALYNLSLDEKASEEINTSIREYINEAMIALIATPAYDCPVCGHPNENNVSNNETFKDLVPLNMIETFFVLSALRIQKVHYPQV